MTGWDGLQSDSERFSAGQPRPLWLTAIWGKLDDLIWSKCISTHKPWDFYWVCPKFSGQLVVFEDLTALETAKEVAEQTQQFALAEAIDRELVAKWLEGPATDETHPETAGEKPNILDLFKRFKPSFNSFYGWQTIKVEVYGIPWYTDFWANPIIRVYKPSALMWHCYGRVFGRTWITQTT